MITNTQIVASRTRPSIEPRVLKIPPRAEFMLRHINRVMIGNSRNSLEDNMDTMRPPIVSLAFTIVNETNLLDVSDYPSDVQFQVRQ